MSIGVNQLLNAASYFILAYYMTEAQQLDGHALKACSLLKRLGQELLQIIAAIDMDVE